MPQTAKPQSEIEALAAALEAWRRGMVDQCRTRWAEITEHVVLKMAPGELFGEHAAAERHIANSNQPYANLLRLRDQLWDVWQTLSS